MADPQVPAEPFEPKKPGLVAVAVYLVTAATLMWPIALDRFLVNPLSDQYSAGYSFRLFGAEMFRATGHIPQWNPYLFGGLPFIGAMHGDIFYPTAWLRWFLPTDLAMSLGFAIHFVLAGLFAYALMRALRLSWAAALTGGVAYQLTGILASLVNPGHDGKLFVSALAPLAFLALLRAIRDRRPSGYGIFALVVGLCLVSPHYQLTYYLLVATGLWALYLTFLAPDRPRGPWWKPLGLALAAVLLGVAISAVQALPFWEYIPYSPRGEGGSSLGWAYATNFSLPPSELIDTLLPQFHGIVEHYWGANPLKFHSEYLGAVVVLLAAVGVGDKRHRHLLMGLGGIAALFLLIALGKYTPFYRVWYEVMPMMKKVRAPGMAFYLVALPVAVAAGIGADRLLRREVSLKAVAWVAGAIAALGVLGLTGVLNALGEVLVEPQKRQLVAANLGALRLGSLRLVVVALLGGAACWAVGTGRLRRGWAALALVAVVTADQWSIDREFARFSPPADVLFAPDEIITTMQQADGDPFRVLDYGMAVGQETYPHSYLMAFRILNALGYHGNELRFYDDLLGGKNVWQNMWGTTRLWDLLAIRYVLLPTVENLPGFTRVLGPVRTTPGGYGVLYQRDTIPPYARVMSGAAEVPDGQIDATVNDPRFPLERVVLYPDTVGLNLPRLEAIPPPSPIVPDVAEWAPGAMTITLSGTSDQQAFLLVSENWYPDWHATIDGQPAKVLRGQGSFLSVVLPPGAREVQFSYASSAYPKGKAVTALALLMALLWIAVPEVRARRLRRGEAAGA